MERLQKVIAQAGIASRRKAEELIVQGKVKVNDELVQTLGTKVSANDKVEVEGVPLEREEPVYFMLYKPRGVITAVADDKGRKVVTDFFVEVPQRIYPIGRLDYQTSGLLLLTNDGAFANAMMHPKHTVDKTYVAKVEGLVKKGDLNEFKKGVELEDGKTAPAKAKVISRDTAKKTSIVELTIHEGKNRQVRRMFEALGFKVLKLKRERYAFLTLQGLNAGEYRELTPHEVKQLRQLAVT
ncbi:rRNA pseudouridine synthase [Bacillaceae bacterium SIJ1]|uniref:pseudouridine synthase n=1 Tax=Litoribacterium kuwaitense TaxID=1398745 RepID=UPI0013ED1D3D|nr:pseudouridine synthase [Litoribacterium kuwaitense]NGP43667.1 rRNA pseudouridine synthase [Litoribacterium kuwaitense]